MKTFRLLKESIEDLNGTVRNGIFYPGNTLGIARGDMPQITTEHFPAFVDSLDVRITKTKQSISSLKPIQKEINIEKAEVIKRKQGELIKQKPIIISSDNYVLDGHHRWLAILLMDKNANVPVVKINMPIRQLLDAAHNFDKVEYRDINTFKH